jgi:hypothetical protein
MEATTTPPRPCRRQISTRPAYQVLVELTEIALKDHPEPFNRRKPWRQATALRAHGFTRG